MDTISALGMWGQLELAPGKGHSCGNSSETQTPFLERRQFKMSILHLTVVTETKALGL